MVTLFWSVQYLWGQDNVRGKLAPLFFVFSFLFFSRFKEDV